MKPPPIWDAANNQGLFESQLTPRRLFGQELRKAAKLSVRHIGLYFGQETEITPTIYSRGRGNLERRRKKLSIGGECKPLRKCFGPVGLGAIHGNHAAGIALQTEISGYGNNNGHWYILRVVALCEAESLTTPTSSSRLDNLQWFSSSLTGFAKC
ncbi:hypothetical protein K438DRAFT_1945021 [Mycena galopus ATCC 62051]|nr:hypothetical protein K438DRAFT_1945021 [Mycena galopus ATCC 62051]